MSLTHPTVSSSFDTLLKVRPGVILRFFSLSPLPLDLTVIKKRIPNAILGILNRVAGGIEDKIVSLVYKEYP